VVRKKGFAMQRAKAARKSVGQVLEVAAKGRKRRRCVVAAELLRPETARVEKDEANSQRQEERRATDPRQHTSGSNHQMIRRYAAREARASANKARAASGSRGGTSRPARQQRQEAWSAEITPARTHGTLNNQTRTNVNRRNRRVNVNRYYRITVRSSQPFEPAETRVQPQPERTSNGENV
jgi:cell division septation protein DedD